MALSPEPRGFSVGAGRVARALRVPARRARPRRPPALLAPNKGPQCRSHGKHDVPGRPQLPRAWPKESHQECIIQNFSCHSEPF